MSINCLPAYSASSLVLNTSREPKLADEYEASRYAPQRMKPKYENVL